MEKLEEAGRAARFGEDRMGDWAFRGRAWPWQGVQQLR